MIFPKLNAFGEAFRRNGYQMPQSDDEYVKEKPLPLGAPGWKKVWPNGVWPGQIPGQVPIALRVESLYRYNEDSAVTHDFTFPEELELLTGGTLGEDISFYGEATLFEEGGEGKIERLFLQFDNLFSNGFPMYLLNLRIGQFEPALVPFPSQRRLSFTDYLFNAFLVGYNNFQFSSPQRGIEINGIYNGRLEHALGVINGNGIGAEDESTDSFDNNSKKDLYLRLGYKFFGSRLDGLRNQELEGAGGEAIEPDREELMDNSIKIGLFGYIGENRVTVSGQDFADKFSRYGIDINGYYQDLHLLGSWLSGRNKNPSGTGIEVEVTSYLLEANYLFYPWLMGLLRYEGVQLNPDSKTEQIVSGLIILIRANLKLTIEADVSPDSEIPEKGIIGLDYAF